ncbi:hypothetical protein B296_00022143 [Ensete ventricosum]|uniref:Uncharacterized protein n=1 Tax=Ensete ventricosum TaxID=4639 RepID=A0A426Z8W0_ENSVE|nr:hypothetical protein B296_00022143 [Ensete ventricosum]
MSLPLENQDLSLLDICYVGAAFTFAFFPLEVSKTTIPFGLLRLAKQLVSCSAPAKALARLRLFDNTVPTAPFKHSSCLHRRVFVTSDCVRSFGNSPSPHSRVTPRRSIALGQSVA